MAKLGFAQEDRYLGQISPKQLSTYASPIPGYCTVEALTGSICHLLRSEFEYKAGLCSESPTRSAPGTFTQPDPLGLSFASLADPQSLNMYSYVGNDPMNRVDPNGQFWGGLLLQLIIGLFHNFKPNIINGSFAYHNQPPISVSFTTNFQNIGVSYGGFGFALRTERHWLPDFLSKNEDPFLHALWAARGILSEDNECSRFFKGAGLDAVNAIAWDVYAGGNNSYGMLDPKIGISMSIPDIVDSWHAPILLPGMYVAVAPYSVLINNAGAFGRQASFDKLPRFGGYGPGTLQSRVLQLLHEAGHLVITDVSFKTFVKANNKMFPMYQLTHLLPLDGKPGQESLSETNTERVRKACSKELDALKN